MTRFPCPNPDEHSGNPFLHDRWLLWTNHESALEYAQSRFLQHGGRRQVVRGVQLGDSQRWFWHVSAVPAARLVES